MITLGKAGKAMASLAAGAEALTSVQAVGVLVVRISVAARLACVVGARVGSIASGPSQADKLLSRPIRQRAIAKRLTRAEIESIFMGRERRGFVWLSALDMTKVSRCAHSLFHFWVKS